MSSKAPTIAAAVLTQTNMVVLTDWLHAALAQHNASPSAPAAARQLLTLLADGDHAGWNVAVAVFAEPEHVCLAFDCIPLAQQDPAAYGRALSHHSWQANVTVTVQWGPQHLRALLRVPHGCVSEH